ncbi:MAG: lipocalin-like domain-containing protein [Actinomycetes bacterium]
MADDTDLGGALCRREGRHAEATTEWWYFTGHLTDEQQGRYGFDLQAFVLTDVEYTVRGHEFTKAYEVDSAISDLSTGQFHSSIRRLLPCPWFRMDEQLLDVRLGATQITAVEPLAYRLRTRWDDQAIDLEARATRKPVAHGDGGWVEMGGAGGSHYWSVTRLETTGVLIIDGQRRAVTGQCWMDHQWGSWDRIAVPSWDWFSLRLADGTDVMAYRFADGTSGATVCRADGTSATTTFSYESTGAWTSPATGTTYPSGWRVQIPLLDAQLVVTPELVDQELVSGTSGYWEGLCAVTGSVAGADADGVAYVELAGYSRTMV